MNADHLRLLAGLAGTLVVISLVWPHALALVQSIRSRPRGGDEFAADLHRVVDLAARLHAAGRVEATMTARKLIDDLLADPRKPTDEGPKA